MGDTAGILKYYQERFGANPPLIEPAPAPDLKLMVVIPCFAEPDLLASLDSLWTATRPDESIEVIVVLNGSTENSPSQKELNERTKAQFSEWESSHRGPKIRFHLLDFRELPPKVAGVGLARKIGMDEAVWRLFRAQAFETGIIACFDADSLCSPNYLVGLIQHFINHPRSLGCSIYFEHPIQALDPERAVLDAIVHYELHLRYYVQGLRYAELPFAYHTIGSSMSVRAPAYIQQGGMNRRKAGEDFYFLNKLMPAGEFTECCDIQVRPSSRVSDRVPFGTGRAVQDFLEIGFLPAYPCKLFEILRAFHLQLRENWLAGNISQWKPEESELTNFLGYEAILTAIRESQQNSASAEAGLRRFYRWFDGFKVMKFANHCRNLWKSETDLICQAGKMMQLTSGSGAFENKETAEALLFELRKRQQKPWTPLKNQKAPQ
jgi:hypothetical protein